MKLGQNVCLDEILDEFDNGSCGVKKKVTASNLKKPCVHFSVLIFGPLPMKLGRIFFLMKCGMSFKMGHVGSKPRSLGQIFEKSYVSS